jgi:Xaa-Pro aminopeptidase
MAYPVVPSEDAHASEYIAPCDKRRAFISGFSGSAGCAVVTLDKAALATDGRYFNQASKQLDDNWTLLKQGLQDVPTWQEWSVEESAGGKTVGLDASLIPASVAEKLLVDVKKNGGKDVVAIETNLVDAVWGDKKPAIPKEKIILLPEKYTGKDTKTKLTELRTELKKKKAAGYVMSELDDIAWLFNLRGDDIPYNPVFFSYAIVTDDKATLYVNTDKLGDDCRTYLKENEVDVKPYDALLNDTAALATAAKAELNGDAEHGIPASRYFISKKASWMLKLALGGDKFVEEVRSPVGDAKTVKNETELEGMRQCHIRDGVALIKYFAWLEAQLIQKKAKLDEVEAADKLESLRSQQEGFMGLSFDTISSTGPK